MHGTGIGAIRRARLATLLALLALVFSLQMPGASLAQGLKDQPSGEDPATEEALPDDGDVTGPCEAGPDDITDPEEAGMVGTREYESPQFGYTVEWARGWDLDDYFETPIYSSEDAERDSLCLIWSESEETYGYTYIIGQAASRGAPEADVEAWVDDEFIEQQWPDFDVEVLLEDSTRSSGSVVYSIFEPEERVQYYTIYQSIELDDGSMIYITFSTDEASFEDAFAQVSTDIEIDGDTILDLFDWDEIEEAIDAL
jgi:hypothetical protein